jgi:hypothetical protein
MRAVDDGLRNIQGDGGSPGPPSGHTRICWASALGEARRGRPPEDWDISDERAKRLIADGCCCCTPLNKGGATRATRVRRGY